MLIIKKINLFKHLIFFFNFLWKKKLFFPSYIAFEKARLKREKANAIEARKREKEDKEKKKEELKKIVEEERMKRKEEKERLKIEKEKVMYLQNMCFM